MNHKLNNFDKLSSLFKDVYSEYIKIKKTKAEQPIISLQKIKINFSKIMNNDLITFYKKLKSFMKLLDLVKDNHILIHGFLDNKYDRLIQIKYFLLKLNSKNARSLHDKIFTNIFKLGKHTPLGVTRVFGEFVKGITFFSDEIENKLNIPIYHRAASCGDSSEDFRKKYLRCYQEDEPFIIEQKRQHIYKCYIERLIFDDMFIHSFTHFQDNINLPIEQNKGHKFQLTERANNFNSCFLSIKIKIELKYKDNFPITLIIYFLDNNGKIIQTELFERILHYDVYGNGCYSENVYYTKKDNNNNDIYTDVLEFIVDRVYEDDDFDYDDSIF